jgi:hypothetical protein
VRVANQTRANKSRAFGANRYKRDKSNGAKTRTAEIRRVVRWTAEVRESRCQRYKDLLNASIDLGAGPAILQFDENDLDLIEILKGN